MSFSSRFRAALILAAAVSAASPCLLAKKLQVGPAQRYSTPCAAIAAASDGDTIAIDSSIIYRGDVCQWSKSKLTLIGTGFHRAVIDADGKDAGGKGIWVISGDDTTVENIEFMGASAADMNGAGIRLEGTNLTVRNCYFHDNQEGILTGRAPKSAVLIEFSEFARNGSGGDYTHNAYIGNVAKLIFRYNYSHDSVIGHLLKSRAAQNYIFYNRLTDEMGSGSYEIDLPNGGLSFVVGNLIEQGPGTQNETIVTYGEEGPSAGNPNESLFVVNNTIVNDLSSPNSLFVYINPRFSVPAVIVNNILQGPGRVTNQPIAVLRTNFVGNAHLANPMKYDYRLLPGSPAINAGSDPGIVGEISLRPSYEYVHRACAEARTATVAAIDIGAYEFGPVPGTSPPNAPAECGTDIRSNITPVASNTEVGREMNVDIGAGPKSASVSPVGELGLGWKKLSNATILQGGNINNCPPNDYGSYGYKFLSYCKAIYESWTSWAWDSMRKRLLIWGGGHSDYGGNEIYQVDPSASAPQGGKGVLSRLTNPSPPYVVANCSGANLDPLADGRPNSGHTYGMFLYLPNIDKVMIWARIVGSPAGCGSQKLFLLDAASVTPLCAPACSSVWTQDTTTDLPGNLSIVAAYGAYNPIDSKVYIWIPFDDSNQYSLNIYDPVRHTWKRAQRGPTNATLYMSAVIDPTNQRFLVMGSAGDKVNPSGNFWYDISPKSRYIANHPSVDSSCLPLASGSPPALWYDAQSRQIVGWPGHGNSVYIVDINTAQSVTCRTESYGSTAGVDYPESTEYPAGIFNKAWYDSADNITILCANADKTCWALKRPQ